jgi:8-amino-7-oxononanoate synthase
LLIDDTQALGILGEPAPGTLYGSGGGGSLRNAGLGGESVLIVASLAKGFGVPVAILAGEGAAVGTFERASETRMHCSPASAAVVSAAEHALGVNAEHGDRLRKRLSEAVLRLRRGMGRNGIALARGTFPVQTIGPGTRDVARVHAALLRRGVRTVLHRDRHDGATRLSFVLTAAHGSMAIDYAVGAVAGVLRRIAVPSRIGRASDERPRHAQR